MTYQVQLAVFAGPLDLLLHLIERSELDIYDIPISAIAEQFLSYLRTMELLNLEAVGEFLVMAATLMQIKAKMLLPKPITLTDGSVEEDEEDPRRELVDRLVEYRRIKEAAELLRHREEEQGKYFPRLGGAFADQLVAVSPASATPLGIWDLIEAFQVILAEANPEDTHVPVPAEQLNMRQVMAGLVSALTSGGGCLEFAQVFAAQKTKRALITAFVALLELIRLGRVKAFQEGVFGRIVLRLRPAEEVPQ